MNDIVEGNSGALQGLKNTLARRAEEFRMVLPSHITPDKFQRVIATAALSNPQLLNCDRQSFLMASMKLAQDGLLPDGREAALVPFKTRVQEGGQWFDKWIVTPMPMVFGLRKKILQSGDVLTLQVGVVYRAEYERGNFIYEIGIEPPIRHRPDLELTDEESADSEMIAAYSIARIKNPGSEPQWSVEVMRKSEIMKVRQRSQTGALGKTDRNGKPIPPKGPWVTDEGEMWKKTVMRRHSKVLPMSSDLIDLFERDMANEKAMESAAAFMAVEPDKPVALPENYSQISDQSGTESGVAMDFATDERTGMTVGNEVVERQLDAQNLEGGRADHEHGDQHDGTDTAPAYAVWLETTHERIDAAISNAALRAIGEEIAEHADMLPEEVKDELRLHIDGRKAEILKGK